MKSFSGWEGKGSFVQVDELGLERNVDIAIISFSSEKENLLSQCLHFVVTVSPELWANREGQERQ